jgi:hypothetical protein
VTTTISSVKVKALNLKGFKNPSLSIGCAMRFSQVFTREFIVFVLRINNHKYEQKHYIDFLKFAK